MRLFISFILSLSLVGVAIAASPHVHRDQSTYERAVNVTLDTVMWVHEQHKGRMTWAELNQAVCQHMKVRRTEPWQR